MDPFSGHDQKGWSHREICMIDDDPPLARHSIGIAPLLQGRDDTPLGAQNVGRPPRLSRRKTHHSLGGQLSAGNGLGVYPLDARLGNSEPLARHNLDHRRRRGRIRDVGLYVSGIVAFGSQDGSGIISGLARAPAGLKAIGNRAVGLTYGLNQ